MFNYILLFEKEKNNKQPNLQAQFPLDIEIPDLSLISSLCVPQTITQYQPQIYAFNTPSNNCFDYCFEYQGNIYSIVILSSSLYASLFYDYLHSVHSTLSSMKVNSSPLSIFYLVKSLLLSWSSDNCDQITVNFPNETITLNLSSISSWFINFNVAPLYPHLFEIWTAALENKGILIIAPNAEIASSSVFALFSMLEKLRYADNFLLFTQKGDPRYEEVMQNNSMPYKIVATTDPELANGESHFSTIITIRATSFDNMFDSQEEFRGKTIRLFNCFLIQMNYQLLADPYSDLLNKPLDIKPMHEICDYEFPDDLLINCQKTSTFARWRKQTIERGQFRNAFLSIPPKEAIKLIKPEEYQIAYDQLCVLSKSYQRDLHLQSVFKIHLELLEKKLKKR